MRITTDEARPYFRGLMGIKPEHIPDVFRYYAQDAACLAFHETFHEGVWMVHVGVKREGLGRSDDAIRSILREFSKDVGPKRIIAWTPRKNRAVCALAHRLGFVVDGEMPLPEPILMQGCEPWA